MMELRSFAKINWYLRVLDKRSDGFHNVETIYQEIALADRLRFEPLDEETCEIIGMPFTISPQDNLIYRAWQLLRREFGSSCRGARVTIEKHIPACGGLGGASSNAATTLHALNDMFSLGASTTDLEHLAATLGSDVPFFIRGGCAIGRGRGELLEPLSDVPRYHLLMVFPDAKVPTAEAYRRLDTATRPQPPATLDQVVAALRSGNLGDLIRSIHNDFECLVENEEWFVAATTKLREEGSLREFLSGSGSTVVGVKNILEHADLGGGMEYKKSRSGVIETSTHPQNTSVGKN